MDPRYQEDAENYLQRFHAIATNRFAAIFTEKLSSCIILILKLNMNNFFLTSNNVAAMLNAGGHACAVIAMFQVGGGSFTHGMFSNHIEKITSRHLPRWVPLTLLTRPNFDHLIRFITKVIKASEPVVSVVLGLLINNAVPKPLTALSLLPITYGVAYASTLGQLDVVTMSRELGTMAAK